MLHEHAPEQRADYRRNREHDRDVALVAAALAHRHEVADRRHRQRHQPTGGETLDGTERDQHRDVLRRAAQRRRSDEHHERDLEQRLAPVAVAELAPERRRRRGRDDIRGYDPGDVAEATEVGGDRGQRRREDRLIEDSWQHRQHDGREWQEGRLGEAHDLLLACVTATELVIVTVPRERDP